MKYEFSNKKALIDALESRRSYFEALDKKMMAQHKKAEEKALADFRKECAKAIKADYATAKNDYASSWSSKLRLNAPPCPILFVPRLDSSIKMLDLDGRSRYSISATNYGATIHVLLSHQPEVKSC